MAKNKPIELTQHINGLNKIITDLEKDLKLAKKLKGNLLEISKGNYITRDKLGI